VSNIVISVNGSSAGDGFVVAPDNGIIFTVPLTLNTNDGSTVSATVDAAPNGAGITLPGGNISIGPSGVTFPISASVVSAARGDTTINVHVGAETTTFKLTAISSPEVWWRGRFEARFATDGDYYNNPRGNDGGTVGNDPSLGGPGWTWALEGEPDFVPSGADSHGVPDSVPTTLDKPVGRVIRLNNPVALRQFVAPVATTVNEIHGSLSDSSTVAFTAGDPMLDATVNLGPDTYLAANQPQNPADPTPAETNNEGYEPMALFEFHIDGFLSGQSATLTDRPTAGPPPPSVSPATLDAAEEAIPQFIDPVTGTPTTFISLATFETARKNQLTNAFNALTPAQQASTEGKNLKTRIDHLPNPNASIGWEQKEEYTGQVNDSITFQPVASTVLNYLENFTAFTFFARFFTFHPDELCGYVHGNLNANPSARLVKTCSIQIQNGTFGKDELNSIGLPATFDSAFWVVLDGFFPSELGIDASNSLTNPPHPPTVTFAVDASNANLAAIVNALQTEGQLQIEPFSGPVLTTSLPPQNAPQRILYPFNVRFTGTDGFIDQTETLTLNATITVNGRTYSNSAPLELTTAANPYVINADAGNQYTSWLSTDLRVFTVDDDKTFFGKKVSDFYPPGTTSPISPAAASSGARAYISDLIQRLTPTGAAGGDTFALSLNEAEDSTRSQLEYLPINPRTNKPAYNFAICRVRIRGTTPPNTPPPFTTQARNCRVFFRAFQAQTTVSTFNPTTTYRSTPIGIPDVSTRVPLLGYETDSHGSDEFVTIPFFAVERVNFAGPTDLTTQPADAPNVQTISPVSGTEVDTFFGCWLDMNQQTPLFPQFAKPGDFDNRTSYFNTTGFAIQPINAAFTRAPHQCLIAEVAFDDVPIPPNADASTSDKLAQRNLAYVDGPNPGAIDSRRMPHPFQIQASKAAAVHVDELMLSWGTTPAGSKASVYLPGISAAEVIALADQLYSQHPLTAEDAHTIGTPSGPVTFIPIPKGTGILAGLLTVDLPTGVRRGDVYTMLVRQLTDASEFPGRYEVPEQPPARGNKGDQIDEAVRKVAPEVLRWRRVLGAFQINLTIETKQELLVPEENRLALFSWIAENVSSMSRWHPVMHRYVEQLGGRVAGFGGDPGAIQPSPTGFVPVPLPHHDEDDGRYHKTTGKVSGLIFDHFGDFEGFILETRFSELRRFHSHERRVLDIVRGALENRGWLTVVSEPERTYLVRSIIVHMPRAWEE
jgi:hypothetical protein